MCRSVYDLFHDIHKAHTITVIMGTVAIILLWTIRQLGLGWAWFSPRSKVPDSVRKICKLPWPFILIIVYTLITWKLGLDNRGVEVTGPVPSGLPPFQWPKNFFENIPMLMSAAMQIVIIGFLETFAVESHFATKRRYQVRATLEAFAADVLYFTSC
jgi:SulP family sulfate permease